MSNAVYPLHLYGLVDCNSFFASCEKLFRPDLRDKAVVVLSNNDGIVVARSPEAKKLGIPMGEAYFKIKRHADSGHRRIRRCHRTNNSGLSTNQADHAVTAAVLGAFVAICEKSSVRHCIILGY